MPEINLPAPSHYCIRCLPRMRFAHIIYKGHSLCLTCIKEIADMDIEPGSSWDFELEKRQMEKLDWGNLTLIC